MRIIYVTACMPFGTSEAFLIDEVRELIRRHEVLIVPRSPGALAAHLADLARHTKREELFSRRVLTAALAAFAGRPRAVLRSVSCLMRSNGLPFVLRNLAVLPKALWLAAVAEQWNADHIHCHWAGTTATAALIASKLTGIPWSLTAHRSDIVGNNLLSEKVDSARIVRLISRDGRRLMADRGVKTQLKLRVLPMGVEIPSACAPHAKAQVLLCPADLLPVKGHDVLLHAWRLVLDRGVTGELWLAGEGPLRDSLARRAAELRISDSVKFLGLLDHAELLRLYADGRITGVVLASLDLGGGCREGIPMALVEGMSYGLAVLATTTGGIPELVEPGTGLLVPPLDPVALADGMQYILEDVSLRQKLGRNARRHITETRNVVDVVGQLERWFDREFDPSRPVPEPVESYAACGESGTSRHAR
jgi:glycosyltransferase involved in cell wall biosynthesis